MEVPDISIEQLSDGLLRSSVKSISKLHIPISIGLCLGLSLLFWRLVRFTILPLLRPRDPQEYPYWLPGVGHLFSFFQDSDQLLARAR